MRGEGDRAHNNLAVGIQGMKSNRYIKNNGSRALTNVKGGVTNMEMNFVR